MSRTPLAVAVAACAAVAALVPPFGGSAHAAIRESRPAAEAPKAGFWLLEPVIRAARRLERADPLSEARAGAPSHQRALLRELRAVMREAGPRSGAWVRNASQERLVFGRRSTRTLRLGSNAKLFTVAAALARHGPDARLRTEVRGHSGPAEGGHWPGDLHLVGAGDPTFDEDAVEELARRLADDVGIERVGGGVIADESAFDAVRGTRHIGGGRPAEIGGSLSALGVDDLVVGDPARWAARRLHAELERRGVEVSASPRTGAVPDGARPLVTVESPPMERIAATTLGHSSNFYAEMLAKLVDAGDGGRPATTRRGAAVAAHFARRFGASVQLADGGGLAAGSRGSARSVGRLLEALLAREEGEVFADALAVAGRRGTLRERLRDGDAAGSCRAKTGTRPQVSALSGYCRGAGGDTIVFSLVLNGIDPARAKRLEDRAVEAIARHG